MLDELSTFEEALLLTCDSEGGAGPTVEVGAIDDSTLEATEEGPSTSEDLLTVGTISLIADETCDASEEVRLSIGLTGVELVAAEVSAAEEGDDGWEDAWEVSLEVTEDGDSGARETLSTVEGPAEVALEEALLLVVASEAAVVDSAADVPVVCASSALVVLSLVLELREGAAEEGKLSVELTRVLASVELLLISSREVPETVAGSLVEATVDSAAVEGEEEGVDEVVTGSTTVVLVSCSSVVLVREAEVEVLLLSSVEDDSALLGEIELSTSLVEDELGIAVEDRVAELGSRVSSAVCEVDEAAELEERGVVLVSSSSCVLDDDEDDLDEDDADEDGGASSEVLLVEDKAEEVLDNEVLSGSTVSLDSEAVLEGVVLVVVLSPLLVPVRGARETGAEEGDADEDGEEAANWTVARDEGLAEDEADGVGTTMIVLTRVTVLASPPTVVVYLAVTVDVRLTLPLVIVPSPSESPSSLSISESSAS